MGRTGMVRVAVLLAAWIGLAGISQADDWMVDRLRGEVLVMTGNSWVPLQRGDIVSDSSRIRSADGSRVTFTRGAEAIELSGASEIRIFDQQGERMTTIMQAYGTVTVEAERLQIQHFSVQTPFLAAIVKGTRFTVHSNDQQSSVDVARGLVQVQDYVHGVATDIAPGQSAVVSDAIALSVTGGGSHAPVVTLDGQLVAADGQGASNGNHGQGNNGNHGLGNNGNGNGGQGNSGNHGQGNNGNGGQGNNGNNGNNGNGGGNGGQGNNGNQGNGGNGGQGHNGNQGQGNDGSGGQGNNGNGNGNDGQGNGGKSGGHGKGA